MPNFAFHVDIIVRSTIYIEVEADSAEEAARAAKEQARYHDRAAGVMGVVDRITLTPTEPREN